MADLPPLLLGPILRRVEPRLVSVFVATSRAADVRVALYQGIVDAAAPPAELASGHARTTRFGAAFHAVVATVEPAEALQPGQLYSYDVTVSPDGAAAQSLSALGLLADSTLPGYGSANPFNPSASQEVEVPALGYAEGRLPTFVTCPAALDELVLAHASCRKPHGSGYPALRHLDEYVDDLDGAAAGRPHMLFLTGDQIYADDVATALLPGLSALGIDLLGDVEAVPRPHGAAGAPLSVTANVLPPGFRQKLTGAAGFTSEAAASHLIGFGEFLAMYCVAWNPQLWPVLARVEVPASGISADLREKLEADVAAAPPEAPIELRRPSPDAAEALLSPLYNGTPPANEALADAFSSFWSAKVLLDDYRREVPRVRRLLANVPTYMICDDHEITDDWFMTGGIRAATTGDPLGKALLRNGLAAYAICQAWGDDPKRWADDAQRRALLTGIGAMFPDGWTGGLPQSAGATAVDGALGLSPGAQPQFDFSFTVAGPRHRVRVLDTRTRRQYDSPATSPGLLTAAALDEQLPDEDLPEGHVLVLVSPAPVFGPAAMNEIGGAIAASAYDLVSMARDTTVRAQAQELTGLEGGKPTGMEYFDAEHWSAHPAAFERLLARLSKYPRVVVLAGDVHYAAAFAMDWTAPAGTSDPRTSRIVHFTSSAARNAWMGLVRNLMSLNGMATGLQRIGMPMTRLGWTATQPPVVDDLAPEPPLTRIRVQTAPVLLSDELFRRRHDLRRPPEWLWRSQPITDARAPADRPPAARAPEPATDLPADRTAVRRYGEAAALHVQALGTVAIARGLQFLNNAGLITFATEADGIHVSQSLYSLRPRTDPGEKGDAYVVHEARLEPDPVPVPTAVGPA